MIKHILLTLHIGTVLGAAQSTTLTINPATGTVNVPTGVTPNFLSLKLDGTALSLPLGNLLGSGESYDNPPWLNSLSWPKLTSRPTTLNGYGITDPILVSTGAYSDPDWLTSLSSSKLSGPIVATHGVVTTSSYANPDWLNSLAWTKITGTPTSLNGYGITDPVLLSNGNYSNPSWLTSIAASKLTGTVIATNGVITTSTYSNPAWLSSLAWPKIAGTPTTLSGYGISDPVLLSTGSYPDPSWLTSLSASKITSGTIASTRGGAGTVAGILKANGSGSVSAAIAGTDYQSADADLNSLANVSATGLLVRTGPGTSQARSLVEGPGILITNGDGLADNPTITARIATQNEVDAGTDDTKLITPKKLRQTLPWHLARRYRLMDLTPTGWTATISGSGFRDAAYNMIDIRTGTTPGSSVHVRNNANNCSFMIQPGQIYSWMDWFVPIRCSVMIAVFNADPSTKVYGHFGDAFNDDIIGDLTSRGIGFRIDHASLKFTAHDGATLTVGDSGQTLTSGATPIVYLVEIASDGIGNINGYLNGTQVYSGSGGPNASAGNGSGISFAITNGSGSNNFRVYISEVAVNFP